jgi:hypothetical protein
LTVGQQHVDLCLHKLNEKIPFHKHLFWFPILLGIDANLGGTEIFDPLETIFKKPSIEGYLRQIFVLTDGEVTLLEMLLLNDLLLNYLIMK